MLDIDTAIKHCLDIADGQDKCADISVSEHAKERIRECANDHRQLAEWLTELKEAKRLLKAAVDGYRFIGHITKDYACPSAASCSACPMDEGKQCRIWEHADEALALIGEEGDTNE